MGEKEIETRSINLRRLGSKESQTISLDAAIKALSMEATPPDIKNKNRQGYSNKLNAINFDKKELEIVRRNQEMTSGQKEVAARVNASIICKEVRLIDADGNMVGIVTPEKANTMAIESGLDLVEISPNASPPVCKIMDFGKFKYDQQKREAEARKKQKTIELKEIKFRPNTDKHDYEVKMRSVTKFLENGDKVKDNAKIQRQRNGSSRIGRRTNGTGSS